MTPDKPLPISPTGDRPMTSDSTPAIPTFDELLEDVLCHTEHDAYMRCPAKDPDYADYCNCGLRVAIEDLKEHYRLVKACADSGFEIIGETRAALGLKRGELLTEHAASLAAAPVSPVSEPREDTKSVECCTVCGQPKDRTNSQPGDEVVHGWSRCVNPDCVAFDEPKASAWFRPASEPAEIDRLLDEWQAAIIKWTKRDQTDISGQAYNYAFAARQAIEKAFEKERLVELLHEPTGHMLPVTKDALIDVLKTELKKLQDAARTGEKNEHA